MFLGCEITSLEFNKENKMWNIKTKSDEYP